MKLLLSIILGFSSVNAMEKTICGPSDDRAPSNVREIGRLLDSKVGTGGCTLTMISENCGVSAGHCKSVLRIAEFNTPESIGGDIQHPGAEDVYEIEQSSIESANNGPGDDWAVFKVKPNEITGKSAGAAQGYYQVSFETPANGTPLSITGYGLDRNEPTKNLAQQAHRGELVSIGQGGWYGRAESTLDHKVDTMGGNSGSTIINVETGKVIGIHTHGGCGQYSGSNQGTAISKHETLMNAIRSCLESDI